MSLEGNTIMLCTYNIVCSCVFHILANPNQDPDSLCLDGRFNHHHQLQSRLDFVRCATVDIGAIACALHTSTWLIINAYTMSNVIVLYGLTLQWYNFFSLS